MITKIQKKSELQQFIDEVTIYLSCQGYMVDDATSNGNIVNAIHVDDANNTISIGIWKLLGEISITEQTVDENGKFHRRPITDEVVSCAKAIRLLEYLLDANPETFKRINEL